MGGQKAWAGGVVDLLNKPINKSARSPCPVRIDDLVKSLFRDGHEKNSLCKTLHRMVYRARRASREE